MVELIHTGSIKKFVDCSSNKSSTSFFIFKEPKEVSIFSLIKVRYLGIEDQKWHTIKLTPRQLFEMMKFGITGFINLKGEDHDSGEWKKRAQNTKALESARKSKFLRHVEQTMVVDAKIEKIKKKMESVSKGETEEIEVHGHDDSRKCPYSHFNYQDRSRICIFRLEKVDEEGERFLISFDIPKKKEVSEEDFKLFQACGGRDLEDYYDHMSDRCETHKVWISPRDMALLVVCDVSGSVPRECPLEHTSEEYFRKKEYPFLNLDSIFFLP